MKMNTSLRHRNIVIVLVLVASLTGVARSQVARTQLASVEQLKNDAFKALRSGQFDRTSELLTQAASMSPQDASLLQMSDWMHQFQTERDGYAVERNKGFEKTVADVKKLVAADFQAAAVDKLKDAALLTTNKEAFLKEDWVVKLLSEAKAMGEQFEAKEQWIKAQRIYSDLTSLEPGIPLWKENFKTVTGRLRLLAMYAPDDFKKLIDEEVKSRETADQLVSPTTQPTTKPVAEDNDGFKTDWHDTMRGIRMDMLLESLDDARQGYWKDVSYKTLTAGGLKSLHNFASTRGLEQAFPSLGDDVKRKAFLVAVDQGMEKNAKTGPNDDNTVLHKILDNVRMVNDNTLQIPEEVLIYEFADGAFAELDPFSTVIWPTDWDEFIKSVQGEFSGVGIQIQSDDDGNLKVVSPLEDTPAYKLGISAGDIITRINGKNAKGISINQAVKNITGPSGTTVVLTIKSPNGQVKDYNIRRETIHVASVKGYQQLPGGGWDYFVDPGQKIAYVRLTSFTKTTEEELTQALNEMKKHGAKAIVMDLRNNPGGLLPAATDVCDNFLSSGVIVSTKGERDQPNQPPFLATKSPDDITLPVVVLVNQFSASASEIVSGALQDQHRALIVGERTFGKGSVQVLFPLPGKSAELKLTTAHYYLPSGRCIHKEDDSTTWGVDPDLSVEMTGDQMRQAQEARIAKEVLTRAGAEAAPTTGPAKKDLLAVDPQLSAAVLLLRLQVAGATM